ncbi:hypothetical protein HF086_001606 [Spodoptera exigua]|uniref:DDE Tnp4 domain-containing protein n=1 Tax=Spodoptera exigua TaxID=7107 RepID=A0A922MPS7_SPOEX|nr:hypothetical protein HF086_001606 [Spodoptera exigua]
MNLNIVRYFDASDSEDSSDDDNVITHFILMRRPKTFRVRNSPLETWDDVDFCQRYRLSKETVMWIVCEIGDYLKTPTTRYLLICVKKYLLTPLADPQTPAERLYNESHIRTRNVVERTFGVWKRRFPCIGSQLRVKLENVQPIIVSTAILHNICIDKSDHLPHASENVAPEDVIENYITYPITANEQEYRNQLIRTYFAALLDTD